MGCDKEVHITIMQTPLMRTKQSCWYFYCLDLIFMIFRALYSFIGLTIWYHQYKKNKKYQSFVPYHKTADENRKISRNFIYSLAKALRNLFHIFDISTRDRHTLSGIFKIDFYRLCGWLSTSHGLNNKSPLNRMW